jgi:CubicO group peptidase (beta-lactamase class C family)
MTMAQIVADLEAFAQAEMAKQKVPGLAFAVIQGDKLVHAKGYGVKKLAGTDSVDAHTVFEIGSTTKAFTSALVGMLVDQGALKWVTVATFVVSAGSPSSRLFVESFKDVKGGWFERTGP